MAGPAGGTNCRDVLWEEAKENKGELDEGFEIVFEDGTGEDTERGDEPNTVGRFGREAGSVLWQLLIANRINNANP